MSNEREILQKLIQDGKDAEVKLEALDKQDKPKLGHGDYGVYNDGSAWSVLLRNYTLEVFGSERGEGMAIDEHWPDIRQRIGNIFDDLKDMGEELEEFEVKDCDYDNRVARFHIVTIDNRIKIETDCDGVSHFVKIANPEDFHRKLGRFIMTAKKRAK